MWRWFHQWGSPKFFYHRSGALIPVLALASGLILGAGVFWGLLIAPADYQQGESVRIMYVHVPAAILAQSSYAMMAVMALISLIWRLKIADAAVQTVAPIGACITLLALATGSLWGKPMWGTYWVWDARLTSTLILFFFVRWGARPQKCSRSKPDSRPGSIGFSRDWAAEPSDYKIQC